MSSGATNVSSTESSNLTQGELDYNKMAVELLVIFHQQESKIVKCAMQLIKDRPAAAKEIFTSDIHGWTFAHACVLRGSPVLVQLILGAGVDANSRLGDTQIDDSTGHCTLLHLAAYRGDLKIVNLLLSYNANVEAVDTFGECPLAYAKRRQHKQVYPYLRCTAVEHSHGVEDDSQDPETSLS